jgi:hypothetical protein
VILFHQGTAEQGADFLDRFWPEARAVSDPEYGFFGLFGLARGSSGEVLGPGVWGAAIRAALKGNFVGRPVGDPWVMPGMYLIEGDRILWRHDYKHAGDHPDLREAAKAAAA